LRHSPRRLSEAERQAVLDVLHEPRFADQPPAQVWAKLLDEGYYLCSIRTMHRVLAQAGESGERRIQRPKTHHPVPRLCAQAPNVVWTWDITKLATWGKAMFLSLNVALAWRRILRASRIADLMQTPAVFADTTLVLRGGTGGCGAFRAGIAARRRAWSPYPCPCKPARSSSRLWQRRARCPGRAHSSPHACTSRAQHDGRPSGS
jgi:hypothetical protein